MTCATCIHWKRKGGQKDIEHPDDAIGDCRRHPPRIVEAQLIRTQTIEGLCGDVPFEFDTIGEATMFPITFGGMGCGEEQGQMPC